MSLERIFIDLIVPGANCLLRGICAIFQRCSNEEKAPETNTSDWSCFIYIEAAISGEDI